MLLLLLLLLPPLAHSTPLFFFTNDTTRRLLSSCDDSFSRFEGGATSCHRISIDLTALRWGGSMSYPTHAGAKGILDGRKVLDANRSAFAFDVHAVPAVSFRASAGDETAVTGENNGVAVLVVTEMGVTGNIPDVGGFMHIAPCGGAAEDCHTLTFVSAIELAKKEVSDVTDAEGYQMNMHRRRLGQRRRVAGVLSGLVDPQCESDGIPSEDYLFCCPNTECSSCASFGCTTGPCCGPAMQQDRMCDRFPAPCIMIATLTVTVAYTPQVQSFVSDMNGFIKLAVAETNAGYLNSQIPIALILKQSYMTTQVADQRDSLQALLQFQGSDRRGANIAVLLVQTLGSCGRAFLDCAQYEDDNCAYAVVAALCATGYYSFGHEIGHIQGADHNIEAGPSSGRFADNHGYAAPGISSVDKSVRSIMSYAVVDEPRVLVWSSPSITYEGRRMGLSGSAHNARVLRETRYDIAALPGLFVSKSPSFVPTRAPTRGPTSTPTLAPSRKPTRNPTLVPSNSPSTRPTYPSASPTQSESPTALPTFEPTTGIPTVAPTSFPSRLPSLAPSTMPTRAPSHSPTIHPSNVPTVSPSVTPSNPPTSKPTKLPSSSPTVKPTPPTRNANSSEATGISASAGSTAAAAGVPLSLIALGAVAALYVRRRSSSKGNMPGGNKEDGPVLTAVTVYTSQNPAFEHGADNAPTAFYPDDETGAIAGSPSKIKPKQARRPSQNAVPLSYIKSLQLPSFPLPSTLFQSRNDNENGSASKAAAVDEQSQEPSIAERVSSGVKSAANVVATKASNVASRAGTSASNATEYVRKSVRESRSFAPPEGGVGPLSKKPIFRFDAKSRAATAAVPKPVTSTVLTVITKGDDF